MMKNIFVNNFCNTRIMYIFAPAFPLLGEVQILARRGG